MKATICVYKEGNYFVECYTGEIITNLKELEENYIVEVFNCYDEFLRIMGNEVSNLFCN